MSDYLSIAAQLAAGRTRRGRLVIGPKTTLRQEGDRYLVCCEGVDLLVFGPDGITLQSGGAPTLRKAQRLSTYLPAGLRCETRRGVWWLRRGGRGWYDGPDGRFGWHDDPIEIEYRFADGLVLGYDGALRFSPLSAEAGAAIDRTNRRVTRQTWAYGQALTPNLVRQAISHPDSGCIMCDCEPVAGVSFGDALGDARHLEKHMADRLYPYHLLRRARRRAGAGQTGQRWTCFSASGPWGTGVLHRALVRYLRRRLYQGTDTRTRGRPAPEPALLALASEVRS